MIDNNFLFYLFLGGSRVIMTSGGNLRQQKIFHLTHFYEPNKLRIAVFVALRLADKAKMKSIVFPVFDCSKFDDFTLKTKTKKQKQKQKQKKTKNPFK